MLIILRVLIIITTCFFCHTILYAAEKTASQHGVTFSHIQCGYLGLQWKEVYSQILNLRPDIIRLGAYWNLIEPSEGEFDFEYLDYQIEEARKRNIEVILTIGMKAPRWPEYFIPEWVNHKVKLKKGSDVAKNKFLREATLNYIEKVMQRYKYEPAITIIQVENEPLLKSGPDRWWINSSFLQQEIDVVKKLDPYDRPIMVNSLAYPNFLLRFFSRFNDKTDNLRIPLQLSDIMGINIYPIIAEKLWFIDFYFRTRTKNRRKYLGELIAQAKQHSDKVCVTELQAEPWEPGQLVHIGKEQPKTASIGKMMVYFNEVKNQDVDIILLWGAEYWYYRKEMCNDASWWNTGKELLHLK